ncbi:M48 family metallopeptidase [Aureliella helgolandensis]|uniref:Peptidase M48 domain-containing protein n=1 Tax=Aureliella helgolandensis TaxID=2527968 RepID=A0A518G072_9BACT|nr:M48 family metallopeptidase [Aureliella helgolandensis]QDV22012.1 hypothetical protein Q31a_02910 [Aureliella helgolandensis]
MSTDFFQRQSDARKSTWWLVTMFALAVIAIVTTVVVISVIVIRTQARGAIQPFASQPEQYSVPIIAGLVTLMIIVGGSLYKILDLQNGGGTRVAESLGGRKLHADTKDPVERRVLNVVEEMALASGVPVPPVYMMQEEGINAFAAGYSPSDAVLGITRGCAEQLTRDELQGVVAHEFSHILNGDMRMSIRLIGVLHGILLIGLAGQIVMRMFFYSGAGRSRRSSSNSNNGNGGQVIIVIMAIGVALLVLGFIGTFFGNLIKAAVSRQREYLADASAVQFTRNPAGIANALKRIGGFKEGSAIKSPHAAEASHMYFAQGVWEGITGLWATHPPLAKRIRAIEPNWNGAFPAPVNPASNFAPGNVAGAAGFAGSTGASQSSYHRKLAEVPVALVDHAIEHVGDPTTAHRDYAADLIQALPETLLEAAHETYSARAVVYALMLDKKSSIRKAQLSVLAQHASPDVVKLVEKLQPQVDQVDDRARLPLMNIVLPSLRAMSAKQFAEFRFCFVELAQADEQIDLFEWMLAQVLMRHLRPQFEPVRAPRTQYYNLQQLAPECSSLLSIVAEAGNNATVAATAFRNGAQLLPELKLTQQSRSPSALAELQIIMKKLTLVSAKHRGRLVDACAAAICADQHVTWQEAELLRGISDLLDCPMPPLLIEG